MTHPATVLYCTVYTHIHQPFHATDEWKYTNTLPFISTKRYFISHTSSGTHPLLIDFSTPTYIHKPLQRVLPSASTMNVSYMYVEFDGKNSNDAYLHIVENVERFDANFGLSVICGIIEESAELLLRNKANKDKRVDYARVNDFRRLWKAHDWTKHLGR
jgi:hypothetical protein